MKKTFFLIPFITLLAACEVDFTPNAEWKNVPSIYCMLDQDDDTTWVRVQRCFLPEDNIYDYGQISDSSNYPQGSITVSLLAYENGSLKDSMAFSYAERDRDSGLFAHQAQPLYWCETRRRLKDNYSYVLSVRDAASGMLLASSDPVSLIRQAEETSLITKPTVNAFGGGFGFYDVATGGTANNCHIKWNRLENARRYQPIVRFYYSVDGDTLHVDLHGPSVTSRSSEVYYPRDLFLDELRNKLKDDPRSKRYIAHVDMYLTCCTEELSAYMSTVEPSAVAGQSNEVFCNINGGVGVVAARRTHLYKSMPSDSSIVDGKGLLYFLTNLGVGLY